MAAVCLVAAAPASASGIFRVGFADSLFSSPSPTVRSEWLNRAANTGGQIVRINVRWAQIAPKNLAPDFIATDPASPGYNWAALDAIVSDATAHGQTVLFMVYLAPSWAEGEEAPEDTTPGSWEPSRAAFGEFAQALAERYSGKYPDPTDSSRPLPAVDYYEAWNEPNLEEYLAPQWSGGENRASNIYRGLLNSFYEGIKEAAPKAKVLAGSLAPFGDPPGGSRTRPVLFLRNLFCLEGGILRKTKCPEPVHFDILSDHPIAVGAPTLSATSPLDVTTPNLGRLTKVLEKAEETKRVLPPSKKPLWVTEFWYDSDPPDPTGVPVDTQARWYEQDLYLFWKQGAEVAIALQLRDAPEGKSYAATYQSGAYFVDGSPKPSATAFRFPFVAHRTGPFKVGVWGIAPRRGKVRLQAQRKNGWKTLATVAALGPGHPFRTTVRLLRYANLRAAQGSEISLSWSQR